MGSYKKRKDENQAKFMKLFGRFRFQRGATDIISCHLYHWKNSINNNGLKGAVLADLTKVFDIIGHDIIIAIFN